MKNELENLDEDLKKLDFPFQIMQLADLDLSSEDSIETILEGFPKGKIRPQVYVSDKEYGFPYWKQITVRSMVPAYRVTVKFFGILDITCEIEITYCGIRHDITHLIGSHEWKEVERVCLVLLKRTHEELVSQHQRQVKDIEEILLKFE